MRVWRTVSQPIYPAIYTVDAIASYGRAGLVAPLRSVVVSSRRDSDAGVDAAAAAEEAAARTVAYLRMFVRGCCSPTD